MSDALHESTANPIARRPAVALVTIEYPPTVGGVAHSCQRLVRALVAEGFEVHVIVPLFGVRGQASQRELDGCQIYEIPIDLSVGLQRSSFVFIDHVRRLDRQVRFNLFHSFFLITAFPCALLAGSRPMLVSIRGGDMVSDHHPDVRSTSVFSLKKARWVTSVNQTFLDSVGELVDLRGRSSVLRNGVEAMPPEHGWRLAECRRGHVGLVGQFWRVKDVPLLVRAYAAIPAGVRRRLQLMGRFTEPREEAWSRTLIGELGIAGEVDTPGERPRAEVLRDVARLHVFVQCSASEGMPNALLEAAACGVPLVATAVGGMQEILTHEENALLVPHGDVRALAAALARVLTDDALAERLSRGSLALADSLSAAREQQAWVGLYRSLLA